MNERKPVWSVLVHDLDLLYLLKMFKRLQQVNTEEGGVVVAAGQVKVDPLVLKATGLIGSPFSVLE